MTRLWLQGNCNHEIMIEKEDREINENRGIRKGVYLANTTDDYYYERFSTKKEIDSFIEELILARNEVFGSE